VHAHVRVYGRLTGAQPDGGCEFWPTRGRAAERFVGPWNASLTYPMLILSSRVRVSFIRGHP
jgi:hypothetical protein